MHIACNNGNMNAIKILLENGADINMKDKNNLSFIQRQNFSRLTADEEGIFIYQQWTMHSLFRQTFELGKFTRACDEITVLFFSYFRAAKKGNIESCAIILEMVT